MSSHEYTYYKMFKCLESEFDIIIQPQVHLTSLIKRDTYYGTEYPKELNRIVDFVVFNSNYTPILVIEIGDSSHGERNRFIRDIYVKKICESVNLKVLYYDNRKFITESAARNRLKKELILFFDENYNKLNI